MKQLPMFVKIMPLYFVLAVLFSIPYIQHVQHEHAMAQAVNQIETKLQAPAPVAPTPISAKPTRIVIPKASVDLGIVDGQYNAQRRKWLVSDREVNFVPSSAPANDQSGTTILYGHAIPSVIGRTKQLEAGDSLYIYGADGSVFEYRYRGSQLVQPTQISLFETNAKKPELLLMTCDGQWFQLRRAMYFDLVKASH